MSHEKRNKSVFSLNTRVVNTNTKRQLSGFAKRPPKPKLVFDPLVSYEEYLLQFRAEFKKRWNHLFTAASTGLNGFTVLGVLGQGSFGKVKLVKKNTTGDLYAAKVLHKEKFETREHLNAVLNEKRVLHSIHFPFHTNLEFLRKDEKHLYLGMTLVQGGELFFYHRRLGNFSEGQTRFYAAQIFLALEYLHFLHLVYRDLKPENICFDLNGYIKLTDYGFTKFVPTHTFSLCGTPEYLSPEMINMRPYSTSVDWWAFGVLLYELVVGTSPFSEYEKKPMEMYEKICSGEYKMLKTFTPAFKNLIGRLLQPNLAKRIGVCNNGCSDIKVHAWFKTIDWYAILNQEVQPPFLPSQKSLLEVEEIGRTSSLGIYDNSKKFFSFDKF